MKDRRKVSYYLDKYGKIISFGRKDQARHYCYDQVLPPSTT